MVFMGCNNHQSISMMMSSNGNIFRVTGPLSGEFTAQRWIPSQRPVTRSFGVSFVLRMNKRLSKQSRRWWFETPSRSLWHHCNATLKIPDKLFDNFVVTDGTVSYHNDNLQCYKWRQNCQKNVFSVFQRRFSQAVVTIRVWMGKYIP